MRIFQGLDDSELSLDGSVLTIGNFDGVHRGHQQLLAQGALFAADRKVPFVALTFEPHPLAVLRPEHAPPSLMRLDDKTDMLFRHGVDIVVIARSDPALLGLEPERFIERVVEKLRPLHIVEGSNFGFGRGRKGNPDTLRELGQRFGFDVCIIDPVRLDFGGNDLVTVSSSMIRKLISEHFVHRAALALGRPHTLVGSVVSGAGRGRGMGFPTANIAEVCTLVPAEGVYAGAARIGTTKSLAGISIGTNPTFGDGERKIEAHLIDFDHDVSGQLIHLEFGTWIRPQRRFDSTEALVAQIASDIEAVRAHGATAIVTPFRRRADDDEGISKCL